MGKKEPGKRQTVDPKIPGSTLNPTFRKTGLPQSPDPCVPTVNLPLDIGLNGQAELVVDTGAEVSLIKTKALQGLEQVKPEVTYTLQTPFGTGKTLGSCQGNFTINNNKIPCNFQVVQNLPGLSNDGLLGNDFLSKHCNVEGPNRTLRFPRTEINSEEFAYPLKFSTEELCPQKTVKEDTLAEQAEPVVVKLSTCSVFSMSQRENAGCKTPHESRDHTPNELANTHRTKLNRRHQITLKEPACVPARSRIVVSIPLRLPEEMLCLSQEISDGVFLANSLLSSETNSVSIGILNASSSDVILTNLNLQLAPANDYTIVPFQTNENFSKLDISAINKRPKSETSDACESLQQSEPSESGLRSNETPSSRISESAHKLRANPPRIQVKSGVEEPHANPTPKGRKDTQLPSPIRLRKPKPHKNRISDVCKPLRKPELVDFLVKENPTPPDRKITKPQKIKRRELDADETVTLRHIKYLFPEDQNDPTINPRIARLEQELNLDKNLNAEEKAAITQLCYDYEDIFYLKGDKLPYTSAISHNIPLVQDQAPINQKMYRLPETQRNIINEQLKEMLENDIVQPSKSPWNSPLLVVPKKPGPEGEKRWRIVVDFRKLNEKTIGDAFPLPRIEDILDQLGHSRYFTTLDLANGYHQVLVDPKDRPKTAFSTSYGHYEFKRMPFGLKGAPATFQRLMNYVLTGLQGLECFVYLDDIVIYGKNLQDHNNKLRKVFDKLRENNLRLQPEKCQFLRREVVYLGHKCSSEGALPDPSKTACVQTFPIPRTVRQVQSFLGLANYYRKFIPDFSKKVRPITNLLRKDVKFSWTDKCQEAFQAIKTALISPPLLIYPDFSKPFNLTTDASNEAIGAVLSQGEVGKDQPIAYASRTLNKAERNYSTIEKELLAIVWASRNFRCYLQGRKFTVYTDHKPLKGVFNVKDPTSRLVRFHHKLSEFDYHIEYKPGKYNTNADALSRIPKISRADQGQTFTVTAQVHHNMDSDLEEESPPPVSTLAQCNAVTRASTRKAQDAIQGPEAPQSHISPNSKVQDNEREQQNVSPTPETNLPSEIETKKPEVLNKPEEIRTVLKDFHDSPFGGHQGVIKTYKRIRRKYWWRHMLRDIKLYIKRCPKCQKMKASPQFRMPMVITDIAEKPFDKVYLDIVGPLEETSTGNKYILTFQDNLTKFVDWYAIPNAEAITIAQIFFDEIVTRYRIPKRIVTDQGSNFLSDLFKKVCKLLRVKKLQTTAYHPQSNGALERAHRPLIEYLRTIVDENPNTWDQFLRTAAFVYNNSTHEGTKLTPMDCLYGFTADVPSNLKRDPEPVYNHESYYHILRYKLQKSYATARKNLLASKQKSKAYYDKVVRPLSFHVGDRVLLKSENRKHKLSQIWAGPFLVIAIPSPVNTVIRMGKRTVTVHNNRLKPYFD